MPDIAIANTIRLYSAHAKNWHRFGWKWAKQVSKKKVICFLCRDDKENALSKQGDKLCGYHAHVMAVETN